jgi:hypothetical protein
MREIIIKIKDDDYPDFQKAVNNSGLRVDEKSLEIIQHFTKLAPDAKHYHL